MDIKKILKQVQGVSFKTVGPFLVADLSSKTKPLFEKIPTGKHGMENVSFGQKTDTHRHKFPSFYKSSDLDIVCAGERFSLPRRALILVLPGVDHSWIPKKESDGSVGSVDLRHRKQILV